MPINFSILLILVFHLWVIPYNNVTKIVGKRASTLFSAIGVHVKSNSLNGPICFALGRCSLKFKMSHLPKLKG